MHHWWLYVLKLENDKWYVGITSKTPEKRFRQHKNGYLAAAWTKHYKPIKIHYTKFLGECDISRAQLYEGRVTRKYMEKYGDNNVRGGDLTDDTEYIRRFGYLYTRDGWTSATSVILLAVIILFLTMYIYEWDLKIFLFILLTLVITELASRIYSKVKNR